MKNAKLRVRYEGKATMAAGDKFDEFRDSNVQCLRGFLARVLLQDKKRKFFDDKLMTYKRARI